MSRVAFTLLAWDSVLVGEPMPQGLISPLQPCLEHLTSGSMDREVTQTRKMLSGFTKPFCAASAKGRAVTVLMGAQCHFVVVSQWGLSILCLQGTVYSRCGCLQRTEMLQLTFSATLWDILNAKEVIWHLVSADNIIVIAKCFHPGLAWGWAGWGTPAAN